MWTDRHLILISIRIYEIDDCSRAMLLQLVVFKEEKRKDSLWLQTECDEVSLIKISPYNELQYTER